MEFYKKIKYRREELGMTQDELAKRLGYKSRSTINKIELGINDVSYSKLKAIATALDTNLKDLLGWNREPDETDIAVLKIQPDFVAGKNYLPMPKYGYTDKCIPIDVYESFQKNEYSSTVPIPIVGEIAAGYEKEAFEDLTNGSIDIPVKYLNGRSEKDFFILKVVGDSMYPMYHDGDHVLILKQSALNYSGSIGAVIYDDNIATLKKVEYAPGEDWMRLVPINPAHAPKRIEGPDLEKCRILGIPKLLIREINE